MGSLALTGHEDLCSPCKYLDWAGKQCRCSLSSLVLFGFCVGYTTQWWLLFLLLLLLKAVQCQNLFLLIFLSQVRSRRSCSKTQAGQVELMSLIRTKHKSGMMNSDDPCLCFRLAQLKDSSNRELGLIWVHVKLLHPAYTWKVLVTVGILWWSVASLLNVEQRREFARDAHRSETHHSNLLCRQTETVVATRSDPFSGKLDYITNLEKFIDHYWCATCQLLPLQWSLTWREQPPLWKQPCALAAAVWVSMFASLHSSFNCALKTKRNLLKWKSP